jgi:PPOX class probable F420-dependent enzyme
VTTALDELSSCRTVLLETRKRDGSWVGTPVNLVVADGRAYFRTYDASGKAKRLRNFPEVRVAPSTIRGRATGPAVAGQAVLLDGADADRARDLLARKHPILHGWLVPWMHRRKGWSTLHYAFTPVSPSAPAPPAAPATEVG